MQILLTVVILLIVFMPGTTLANSVYKVTPRVIDLEVDARDLFTETIKIENLAAHKITIFPSVNEIKTDAGGDITSFLEPSMIDDKSTAITSWISISRAGLEILPGEIVELPISFRIHQDAKPGNYQALIGFGSGTNRPEAENLVRNGQAPGVIVTLALAQNQSEFLRLGNFSIDKFVAKADNQAISYTLSNPGETSVTPSGEIIFYNGRGSEVGSIPVNPTGVILAPGQETNFTETAPVSGYLGKYKAFLSIDYGTNQVASVYDTVFFYVLPWQQLLLIFAVVSGLAIVLTVLYSRRFYGQPVDVEHQALPVQFFSGVSAARDHDINLKK